MEHKIFLGKYRVSADEMALAAAELTAPGTPLLVTEQHAIGALYRGQDLEAGRDVSIEVIPAAGLKPAVRESLEEEARAARGISHINIPALYDFGIEDEQLIYVSEYFDGTSVEEWVNTHGPMPTGAVLRIALQVVAAMGAAAFHKISHHAINPANVILVPGQTPEGDWPLVKVLHFVGVAPSFSTADMAVASFDRSTHYASPEQLRDGKVDFRSGIYSLGATMWFLITGAPPLIAPKGPLAMQPSASGLSVDKLNGMPKRVRRLLAQMLSVDPTARPQDALGFYRQIQECLAQIDRRESMARRFGIPLKSETETLTFAPRRRFPTKALALAAILVALVTVTAVMLPRYLHHLRVRNAEEPIGVPIGVSEATPATAPAVASTSTAPSTAPPAVAEATSAPAVKPLPADVPPVTAQAANTAPANSPPAQANEPAPAAAPSQSAPAIVSNQTPPPPPAVAANPPQLVSQPEDKTPPVNAPETAQPKVAASETRPNPQEVDSVPSTPRPKPEETTRRETEQPATASESTEVATAIPTARPVAPEVRRAEPASPAEAPDETAPATAPAENRVVTTTSKPKKERAKKPKRELQEEGVIARAEPVDRDGDDDAAAPSEPNLSRLPPGRTRARFIGVTADGNWMFSLPSKKIIVVPPPPGG